MTGARSLVTMKQVGLNVATDPLMSLAYLGVEGGMVVLVADDPHRAEWQYGLGVAAGVVGLIGATTVDLAHVTAERVPSLTAGISIFAAALAFLYAWKNKLNVVVVILAAGLVGWLVF